MSEATESNIKIAHLLAETFRGTAKVMEQGLKAESLRIAILESEGSPEEGLVSFGTIGLSDYRMLHEGEEFKSRIELVGFSLVTDLAFREVLANVAFDVMKNQTMCFPGRALPGYVRQVFPNTTVPHLYLTAPALWDSLTELSLPDKRVNWLWALPISDAELTYLREHGDDAFEDKLEEGGADTFDLGRDSVV